MKLFLIGCIIGIGKILPGISGSVLAIRLNVYERGINAITSFFSNKKENFIFLSTLGIGFILMTILGSKVLLHIINDYELMLKIVFTILILTGVPELVTKSKNYLIVTISFILANMFNFLPSSINTPNYLLMGIVEGFSTVVPGISGTAIYLSLGWYDDILELFSNLYLFELDRLIPFSVGVLVSAIMMIKLIAYLFSKYRSETYSAILGFLLASIVLIYI